MNANPSPAVAAGARSTRRAVTSMGATAILLCFAFSFGNVWDLARYFGVPEWIAPLVGPLVDLSAVGLVVGVRYLSLAGVPGRELRPARAMLAGCGLATWALNTADALWLRGDLGAAAFDSLAPALLVGWAEVFPWFLRKFTELATQATSDQPNHTAAGNQATARPGYQPARDQATTTSPPATTPAAAGRASGGQPAAATPARRTQAGATYRRVRDLYVGGERVAARIARELGISASYAQRTLRQVKADLARQATTPPDGRPSPAGDQATRPGDQPATTHPGATRPGQPPAPASNAQPGDQATTSQQPSAERDARPPGRALVALTQEGGGRP